MKNIHTGVAFGYKIPASMAITIYKDIKLADYDKYLIVLDANTYNDYIFGKTLISLSDTGFCRPINSICADINTIEEIQTAFETCFAQECEKDPNLITTGKTYLYCAED